MVQAGYTRGAYMQLLMAARILNAAQALDAAGLSRLEGVERDGDAKGIQAYLLQINGVGPEVLRNFEALRGR
jgi:hypothetical protein